MEEVYITVGLCVGAIITISLLRIRTIHKETEQKIRGHHAVMWAWIHAKRAQIKREKTSDEER